MVQFRRNRQTGGTYFFTVTLRDRRSRALTQYIDDLRHSYRKVICAKPFETVAIVIMPDHLHAVWTLPTEDSDYSGRWRAIKADFARAMRSADRVRLSSAGGGLDFWQSRFWEHTIRDEIDLRRHVDYIHFNPVRHGLVEHVANWPHSSFHRYVEQGELPMDWAGSASRETHDVCFGE